MTAEALVTALEQEGVRLRVEGGRLKLEAPADRVPNQETIAGLRENKAAVVAYLRGRAQPYETQFSSFPDPIARKTEKLESWPSSSLPTLDPYAERMRAALCQIKAPDYPPGMVPWLGTVRPDLYAELTSHLPDEIHRLWSERGPMERFEAVLAQMVTLHRRCCKLYRGELGR